MLKYRKNIGIIILIVIVITALIILIINSKEQDNNNRNVSNQEKSSQNNIIFSNEEKKQGMNELSQILENKTDKCVLIVNGEKISEKEIAYVNFQKNSEVIHKEQEKKDIISEIIKEYVVAQDAKDKGIFLTDEENKRIEERVKKISKKITMG